jgi:hypothetical protein
MGCRTRELYLLGDLPRTFLECAQVNAEIGKVEASTQVSGFATHRDLVARCGQQSAPCFNINYGAGPSEVVVLDVGAFDVATFAAASMDSLNCLKSGIPGVSSPSFW